MSTNEPDDVLVTETEWVMLGRGDGAIQVEDISADYAQLMNPRVQEIFNKPSQYLLYQTVENGEKKMYPCVFMTVVAYGEENIPVAAEYLINEINKLDDAGLLKSCLAPLGTIEFINPNSSVKKFGVFSFFHRVATDEQLRNPRLLGPAYVQEGGVSQVEFK